MKLSRGSVTSTRLHWPLRTSASIAPARPALVLAQHEDIVLAQHEDRVAAGGEDAAELTEGPREVVRDAYLQ